MKEHSINSIVFQRTVCVTIKLLKEAINDKVRQMKQLNLHKTTIERSPTRGTKMYSKIQFASSYTILYTVLVV